MSQHRPPDGRPPDESAARGRPPQSRDEVDHPGNDGKTSPLAPFRPPQAPAESLLVTAEVSKPRIWTALVVPIASIVAAFVLLNILFVSLMTADLGWEQLQQPELIQQWLQDILSTRGGVLLLLLSGQVVFLVAVVTAALLSPQPFFFRLGLVRGRMPVWTWPVFMLATPGVGLMSSWLLSLLFDEPSEALRFFALMIEMHTGWFFVLLAVLLAAVPGLVEELLFRGYMQRRLVERFPSLLGATTAILLTSLVFALAHMDLMHSLGVVLLGIWLGLVAWRSGSTWPAVLCHAANNLLAVISVKYSGWETFELTLSPFTIGILLVSVPALCASLAFLFLFTQDDPSDSRREKGEVP